MLKPEMTKSEIEKDLQGKGNFVQIDHLNRFLKDHSLSMDTKRFIFLKLASFYEASKLYGETGKAYDNAASISLTFAERIKHYTKAAEAYARLGDFNRVDEAVRKAMAEANTRERQEVQDAMKQIYRAQAQALEAEQKRSHAVKFYEKLLDTRLSDQERQEVRGKLADLYGKLGKLHELQALKRGLS
jgi:tetratricopeptide (TPR) repeat protein